MVLIEKIKLKILQILQRVLNLLSKSIKKTRQIVYKRIANIEYENNLKEEISNFNKEIKNVN